MTALTPQQLAERTEIIEKQKRIGVFTEWVAAARTLWPEDLAARQVAEAERNDLARQVRELVALCREVEAAYPQRMAMLKPIHALRDYLSAITKPPAVVEAVEPDGSEEG